MISLELLLILIILLFPVFDMALSKFKIENKNIEFLKISISIWVPTILFIYLFSIGALSVDNLGLNFKMSWQNIVVSSFLLMGIIYLLFIVTSIKKNLAIKNEILEKFKPYINFMPVSKSELLVFTLVLSVSAGICEELLFRSYLYPFLKGYIGVIGAIALSSFIFGLWHLYLGWQEVLRTSIMGILFCLVYIFTNNIFLPIILHIFIDIYSAILCFFAHRSHVKVSVESE